MYYVNCRKCGKVDKPNRTSMPHNVGTSTKMVCRDCSDFPGDGRAKLCRDCCPTGHGTRFQEKTI